MSFTGHIVDGQVVLDEPAPLPDGTPVRVEPPSKNGSAIELPALNHYTGRPYPSYLSPEMVERLRSTDSERAPDNLPSLYDRLKPLIDATGDLDLPTDGAQNIDHYLYGHPKRS